MNNDEIKLVLEERKKFLKNPLQYQTKDIFVIENFLLFDEYGFFDKENLDKYVDFLIRLDNDLLVHAIDQLIKMLQDLNWPGALMAFDFLSQLDKTMYIDNLEKKLEIAVTEEDIEWILNINQLIEKAHISVAEFKNKNLIYNIKEIKKGLN